MKQSKHIIENDPEVDNWGSGDQQQCCGPDREEHSKSDHRKASSIPYDQLFGSKDTTRILLAASIAAGCQPCTSHHVKKAIEAGIPDEEIHESISIALGVRTRATEVMKIHASVLLSTRKERTDDVVTHFFESSRINELTAICAAYAINCSPILKNHIEAGKKLGLTHQEICIMCEIASFIRKKAKSFTDEIIENSVDTSDKEVGQSTDCGCSTDCN